MTCSLYVRESVYAAEAEMREVRKVQNENEVWRVMQECLGHLSTC